MILKYDFWGTVFGILGAMLLALNIGLNWIAFILFLINSILYIIYGKQSNNKNIITLNVVYFILNLIGIYNYW